MSELSLVNKELLIFIFGNHFILDRVELDPGKAGGKVGVLPGKEYTTWAYYYYRQAVKDRGYDAKESVWARDQTLEWNCPPLALYMLSLDYLVQLGIFGARSLVPVPHQCETGSV